MFQKGVKTIFPVGSMETAYALKEKFEKDNPGQIILAGKLVNENSKLRILTGKSRGMLAGAGAEEIRKIANEYNIEL